ncbi:IS5 family transposase [Deinococcus peraridilitoris]|nr:IS5 family transposase [Deinococcus peraridilitoris]
MKLNRVRFKRRTGVYPETFEAMRDVLDQREQAKTKAGRPAALTPDEQLLLTLEFWREYRTQAHLGDDWGVHETTVLRTVERVEAALLASGQFSLPRRSALTTETVYSAVLVDVSEVPCERPKKQRTWYSGKKKRHTQKMQLMIEAVTGRILCVGTGRGATHDLTLLRDSGVRVHQETALITDAGYQGIAHDHTLSLTPHKATARVPLSEEQRHENRVLAHFRQRIEHVIRRLKIFRVLKETYRHRRRRFALRLHLIAALVNLTLDVQS